MTHNAVQVQSWSFVPAVILRSLCHRTWHFRVITGVSHYWQSELRLFSLDTGVCLKITHHLITLRLSCGALRGCAPVWNFPAGHAWSRIPPRVALTALTAPRPVLCFRPTRLARRRLGTANYRSTYLSNRWSLPLFACFWSVFLRWAPITARNASKWKAPARSPPLWSSYLRRRRIKCLCGNVTDMTGDNLQWQLRGTVLAQTPSIPSVCAPQISKRTLVLAQFWCMLYISSPPDSLLWALSKHVIDKCLKLPVSPWTEDKWLCPLESLTI